MNDPFGQAISDYFTTGKEADIQVNSNYTEDETIKVTLFFRDEKRMSRLEKTAIDSCHGRILDVGAAAGCHSLILQSRGFDVTAVEKSPLAADVIKKRGILQVYCVDIILYHGRKFDTILLLMNGAGLGQTIHGLTALLDHLKSLLDKNGQILLDSSDIRYLFEEDDGSLWVDLNSENYYGEMEYEVQYKNHVDSFKWLFIDFDTLKALCSAIGLKCFKIADGDHFDYLARITVV